jgi:3-isopropylmalate/(R)-2-methylmalate dehydratase small subunit
MNSIAFSKARIWRMGSNIDTDALAPGAYMKHPVEIIAQHCLESIRPEFAKQVQPGDVVVADANFGIGSSREQAAGALVHLGIKAVIAPSYSGLFFRNAFNLGLLLITCEQVSQLKDGDHLDFDGHALKTYRGEYLPCSEIPDFLIEMVQAGGLFNLLLKNSKPR